MENNQVTTKHEVNKIKVFSNNCLRKILTVS